MPPSHTTITIQLILALEVIPVPSGTGCENGTGGKVELIHHNDGLHPFGIGESFRSSSDNRLCVVKGTSYKGNGFSVWIIRE